MCYHMHFLANSSGDDSQLSNGPYASRYRIDCRREDVFFCAKNPSRDMISIGWRRYLMSECWLSNHNAVIREGVCLHLVRLENRYLHAGTGGCGRSLPRSEVPSCEVLSLNSG